MLHVAFVVHWFTPEFI